MEDKLWRDRRIGMRQPIRDGLKRMLARKGVENYSPPVPPNDRNFDISPSAARREGTRPQRLAVELSEILSRLLPRQHYMLFILGHGVVVGNDIFLLDEHAEEHSLSLVELGRRLESRFKQEISRPRRRVRAGQFQ